MTSVIVIHEVMSSLLVLLQCALQLEALLSGTGLGRAWNRAGGGADAARGGEGDRAGVPFAHLAQTDSRHGTC
jgi:hypothetical protein